MFLTTLYRTLLYFRPTIVLVIGAGLISAFFNITPFGAFALTVFLTWLQPFIDTMRRVGEELEREARMSPPRPPSMSSTPTTRVPNIQFTINWRLMLSYFLRPIAVVSLLLVVIFAAMYTYLYIRF